MLAARTLRALGARSLAARASSQSRLAALKKPQRHLALAHKTEIDDERMPTTYADYSNHVLLMLCAHGDDQAIRERMVRDVMKVDGVDHVEAEKTVGGEIEQAAKAGLAMSRLPYRVGIAAALVAGFGSIPMCFDLHTVLWFNEQYVTMDVEDAKPSRDVARGRLVVVELDGAAARPGELLPPLPAIFPGPDEEHRHEDVLLQRVHDLVAHLGLARAAATATFLKVAVAAAPAASMA